MLVHPKQQGNPILKHIHHIKYTFNPEIKCDYRCGSCGTIAILFISAAFHVLHGTYLEMRMREVEEGFKVRLVLCLVDNDECADTMLELNKLCFIREFTLLVATSKEEAARYLESFHIYEGKSSILVVAAFVKYIINTGKSTASIQEKVENEFMPIMVKALTSVKSINRTDVSTLLTTFGSFADICAAEENKLVLCPGIGDKKVKRLHDVLHTSFS